MKKIVAFILLILPPLLGLTNLIGVLMFALPFKWFWNLSFPYLGFPHLTYTASVGFLGAAWILALALKGVSVDLKMKDNGGTEIRPLKRSVSSGSFFGL